MKHSVRTLFAVLLCLLCLSLVVSCDETPSETGTATKGETEPSSELPSVENPTAKPEEPTTKPEEPTTNPEEPTTAGGGEDTPIPEKLKDFAGKVIAAFGSAPDPWSFLPEGMQPQAHLLNGTAPDYTTATSMTNIPRNGIGKQMHAVNSAINHAETAFGTVNNFYRGMSTIATLYQNYINKSPDHYANFEGIWNAFAFRITVSDTEYVLLAKASGVCIELRHDLTGKTTTGRIDCGEELTVRYQSSTEELSFSVNAGEIYVSNLEFVRNESGITGYIYETTGIGSARLSTSAILTVLEDYTIVVGNKGDFAVPGNGVNVEVYNSKSGLLLGTEVYETVKLADYDTLWYDLHDITGIQSISAVFGTATDIAGKNPDSVYINGSETVFEVVHNSKLGIKTSRQYDIEFKTMYFYIYNEEKQSYEEQEVLIPMLFVQRNSLDTYLGDIQEKNALPAKPQNTSNAKDNAVIASAYITYKDLYLKMKEALTPEQIIASMGKKNEWFATVTPPEESKNA